MLEEGVIDGTQNEGRVVFEAFEVQSAPAG